MYKIKILKDFFNLWNYEFVYYFRLKTILLLKDELFCIYFSYFYRKEKNKIFFKK